MKSSRWKVLVAATVTGIQDTNVTYPYCRECYGKLNQNCHLNEWSCYQCRISYESGCVPYRYCVRLHIADETAFCNVSVFGKTLQPYFGLPAIEMYKFLDLQHPRLIMEALQKSFIGKVFVFEFKTTFLKNSSDLFLSSVIKDNETSLSGSNLIAYQMISNHCTDNDNVHSCLMQYKRLSCSTNLKMSQSKSLPTPEIPISDSAVSCRILSTDSTSYESIVLSWEITKSESQNFKQSLSAFYSSNSSSFPLNTTKIRELHFPHDHLHVDKNKDVCKEVSQTPFPPRKQLQFLFPENIKPNYKNKVERQEMYQHFENISISEMSQDEVGNTVDLSKDISAKLNPSWKSLSETIESKDICNCFDERICNCSSKVIETCKRYPLKKNKIILCSANNSLEDVNNFFKKLTVLTNPNSFSTTGDLSGDLFATISEKMSSFSEKCQSSTPDLQNRKKIASIYATPEKSLLICNHNPQKLFSQLFDNSNDFQFLCPDQSHLERKLSFSLIIPVPELKKKEKQNNNERTVFSQSKINRQTASLKENLSYQSPKSKSKKRVKKSINKTNFTCLSLNSCTPPPNSSFNRLSSKLSYISKAKTNNCQETFTSTPISDSSVLKDVPFLICAKNCSPQLYEAFGTPMKKTDLQQEDIGCDSPSLVQNETLHRNGFVKRFSLDQNQVSFDLFATLDDFHESLSFSAKNNDEFSDDLFSSESNPSSLLSM